MVNEPLPAPAAPADEEAPRALPAFLVRLTASARASTTGGGARRRRTLGGLAARDASDQRYREAVREASRLRDAV